MGRSTLLAVPLLAAAAFGGWWVLGRDSQEAPTVPVDEATAPIEESAAVGTELQGGPKPMTAHKSAAASPYRVEGTVVDEKGKPVEDVTVRAHANGKLRDPDDTSTWGDAKTEDAGRKEIAAIDDPRTGDGSGDPTGKSDKDGRFAIQLAEAGTYEVFPLPLAGRSCAKAWANPSRMRPVAKVSLRLVPGSELSGRVVEADGKGVVALVSADVTITGSASWWQNTFAHPATATDASGAFVLSGLPDGKATLTVKVAGRGVFTGFTFATPVKEPVVLRLGGGGVLVGHVADSTGQIIAGADVTITTSALKAPPAGSPRTTTIRAKSQADGSYRAEGLVAGPVKRLVVVAAGYTSAQQTPPSARWSGAAARDDAETTLDVVLVRGGSVVGRALSKSDKDGEGPVADAEVFLLGPTGGSFQLPSTPRVTTVDRDGRFRFDDVPLGKYTLHARSPSHYVAADAGASGPRMSKRSFDMPMFNGGGPPPTTTLVLTKEGETFEKNLWMMKGVPVAGVVKGPDGTPIAGARVVGAADPFLQNAWQFGLQMQGPMTLATSGADGRFQIPGVQPGNQCVLTAQKPPFAGKPCKAFAVKAESPPTDVVLELEKGAAIVGRVLDAEGAPLSGANIGCWSQDGSGGQANETTGLDGTFRLDGLPAGSYQLNAWSNSGGSAQKALEPALTSGETREGVELRMIAQAKGVTLSGTVVDEEGNPVPQTQLSAQGANNTNAWVQTDADGAFTFQGLAQGKATITVQTMVQQDGGYVSYAGQESLENATFDAPSEGIRVVVKKKTTVTIAGRVRLPDGSPVPLCTLSTRAAQGADKGSGGGVVQYTAPMVMGPGGGGGEVVGGEFRREVAMKLPFDVVVSGARDAEGRPLNFKTSVTKLTEPSTTLEITLEGGQEIRGKVLGADDSPVVGAWVSAGSAGDRSAEDGSFKLIGLEGDEVSISVQPSGKYTAPAKPTKAKPGATDVVIRLEAGLSIAGRVFGPSGAPVTGNAWVQVMGGIGAGRNHFQAQVDDTGAFKVENLPRDGTYDVTVQVWNLDGRKGASAKPWSKSGVKAGTEDLVVRLEGGATIEGSVVDADGKPVAQCYVYAQAATPTGKNPQGANTDEQGRFTCGGLDADVTYVLRAQQWNGTNRTSLSVRAEAGATNVKLVFPQTTRLTGRLSGDGDKARFSVVARPSGPLAGEADTQVGQAQSVGDGSFALEVPADTLVDLYVSRSNDDRYGFVSGVRAGGGDVTVRLEAGRTIEGTIEDGEGNAVTQNVWVTASSDAWMGSAGYVDGSTGKFRMRGLPPGRYRLRAVTGVGKTSPAVEADAGATGVRLRLGG